MHEKPQFYTARPSGATALDRPCRRICRPFVSANLEKGTPWIRWSSDTSGGQRVLAESTKPSALMRTGTAFPFSPVWGPLAMHLQASFSVQGGHAGSRRVFWASAVLVP
jgi:hypothetical protein